MISKFSLIKIVLIILLLVPLLFLSQTYGKWEYLSFKYANEFREPIIKSTQRGCLLEDPEVIKVMEYSTNRALVWMKGTSKSTYLIRFSRSKGDEEWNTRFEDPIYGTFCDFDIINSTMGGSADDSYWYN